MNLLSILFPQTIYKTTSNFSGEIRVIDHAFERRLVVGGLTQSGGITRAMWRKALSFMRHSGERSETRIPFRFWTSSSTALSSLPKGQNDSKRIRNVLILGLGAGTIVEVINEKWPDAKIVGVEIDPAIIEIGKRFFQLDNAKNLEIIIGDALDFIDSPSHPEFISGSNKAIPKLVRNDNREKFDLIIVDLYKGFLVEKNIYNYNFLHKIAQKSAKNAFVIFNIVRLQNDNFEAKKFLDKLERIFQDILCKRIISNDFFFCIVHHQRR